MNIDLTEDVPESEKKIAAWKVTLGVIAACGVMWAAIVGGYFFFDWLAHYIFDAINTTRS